MAGTKEIRVKIASIKSTQKITKAMEMVAASKMRRAQERMKAARPYADKIRSVIGHLRMANSNHHHPFLVEREVKSVGMIIVSSDRGLCGSLNVNVFKQVLIAAREYQKQGVDLHLCLIGSKAMQFFRRLKLPITASITHLGDKPRVADLLGTVKAIEQDLMVDGLVRRYRTSRDGHVDGLPKGEGVFLACSFWLADNYILQGHPAEGRRIFERLMALCNDVGLLAEEYDPVGGRMLGNFPQAFSHVALVNTALNLFRAGGPAADRISI